MAAILLWFLLYTASLVHSQDIHIVYFGDKEDSLHPQAVEDSHYALLESVLGSAEAAKDALVYSYKHGFSGFAARLTQAQAAQISEYPNVASVFISKHLHPHTTSSWEFLGVSHEKGRESFFQDSNPLYGSLWKNSNYGKDIIIGVIDSGVWPESESFSDHDMDPVPSRWKGTCETGQDFNSSNCNKKLIGARFYASASDVDEKYVKENGEFLSARDGYSHGTHCASTAGGRLVSNADWSGSAKGVAKGGAPMSRIAVYKVCWRNESVSTATCSDAALLKALDDGIQDGVDIFSVSIGWPGQPREYTSDGLAIGAFHAMQKGITVVASAGNSGSSFGPGYVENVAPWIITVAASSTDRRFTAEFTLGDNSTFKGPVIAVKDIGDHDDQWYPLVSSVDAGLKSANFTTRQTCLAGSLDRKKVNGKVVVCKRSSLYGVLEAMEVRAAGGAGMILYNSENFPELQQEQLDPEKGSAVYVSPENEGAIFSYINSTELPEVRIFQTKTEYGARPAPLMAQFSSRGPNGLTPEILKPDITAPGVNILAAFSQANDSKVKYGFMSGTSMSCPHVSGVAALLKVYRPDWSPAAIKSALVTTARATDNLGEPIKLSDKNASPFEFGGGHIDPNKAAHPGLVYDANEKDYTNFLCGLHENVRVFTQNSRKVKCPDTNDPSNLNYPSISIVNLNGTKTVTRRVTNVDDEETIYRAIVEAPRNISIAVHPQELHFKGKGETKSFEVTFKLEREVKQLLSFGSLTWSNDKYSVRSPIAIFDDQE